jgi:hypothetical protein
MNSPAPHWFELNIRESILRRMSRVEYKAAMSWLRAVRREILRTMVIR